MIDDLEGVAALGQTERRGSDMRALLSVYDKTGLVDLAQGLGDLGWELVASGKTAAALAEAGIASPRWPTSPAPPRCSGAG